MAPFSRRLFLLRSSLAAASVAVAPALVESLGPAASDAPAADEAVTGADAGAAGLTEPLVAHVKDLSTGEISLFSGTREFVTRDPQLAGRLFRAAR
ncbi:MAG TPA: hypothetical protein VMR97_14165 [Acidimicrobiales bacterium]|nr:hypothetical protein [Acidimicrobiales bacterium]